MLLAYDDAGREVLRFVTGDVPVEPLPAYATSTSTLVDLARMIRRLHDAAESWVPPPDDVWGGLPGDPPPGVKPLFEAAELVSHQDYCPGNVAFRHGPPVALIDLDLTRPTLVDADVSSRVRVFADAFGMTPAQRSQVVRVAQRRAHNAALTLRAAADVDPVFRRWWDEGADERAAGHVLARRRSRRSQRSPQRRSEAK